MTERTRKNSDQGTAKNSCRRSQEQMPHHEKQSMPGSMDFLRLQRVVGNRAVQRLISENTIGRQSTSSLVGSPKIQAKLQIDRPDDQFEKQADRVAEQIMRMPDDENISKEEHPPLQRKPLNSKSPEIHPHTESEINVQQGGGHLLPNHLRAFFEPRFGCDFSDVRIHRDTQADQYNHALNARAFTLNRHIYFSHKDNNLNSPQGRRLLAHELTHVVQQGAARDTAPEPPNRSRLQTKADSGTTDPNDGPAHGSPINAPGIAETPTDETMESVGAGRPPAMAPAGAPPADEKAVTDRFGIKTLSGQPPSIQREENAQEEEEELIAPLQLTETSSAALVAQAPAIAAELGLGGSFGSLAILTNRFRVYTMGGQLLGNYPLRGNFRPASGVFGFAHDGAVRYFRTSSGGYTTRSLSYNRERLSEELLEQIQAGETAFTFCDWVEMTPEQEDAIPGPTLMLVPNATPVQGTAREDETAEPRGGYGSPTAAEGEEGERFALPALPARIQGLNVQPVGGTGVYVMAIDYTQAASGPMAEAARVSWAMLETEYVWEIWDISDTADVQQARTRARAQAEIQRGETPEGARAQGEVGRTAAVRRGFEETDEIVSGLPERIETEQREALAEERYFDALAEEVNRLLLGLDIGARYLEQGLRAVGDLTSGDRERQVPWSEEGVFVVRCVATINPNAEPDERRRAPSVATKAIVVTQLQEISEAAIEAPERGIDDLWRRLQYLDSLPEGAPERVQIPDLERQLEALNIEATGSPVEIIEYRLERTRRALREAEEASPMRGTRVADRRVDRLRRRVEHLEDQLHLAQTRERQLSRQGAPSQRARGVLASRRRGRTYPLLLQISEPQQIGDSDRWECRLSDVTNRDAEPYTGVASTALAAVWEAVERFADAAQYGEGSLTIRLPNEGWYADLDDSQRTRTMESFPCATEAAEQNLERLATVLASLGLIAGSPVLGMAGGIIAATVAGNNIYERLEHDTFHWDDPQVINDLIDIFSLPLTGVSAIGRLRLRVVADAARVAEESLDVAGVVVVSGQTAASLDRVSAAVAAGTMSATEARDERRSIITGALLSHAMHFGGRVRGAARHEGDEGGARPEPAPGTPEAEARPTDVDEGPPTVLDEGRPTIVDEARPTIVDEARPTIVDEARPTIVDEARPTIVDEARPTIVDEARPTIVDEARPTVVDEARPTVVDEARPTAPTESVVIPTDPTARPTAPTEPAAPAGGAQLREPLSGPVRPPGQLETAWRTEDQARQIRDEYARGIPRGDWEPLTESGMIEAWRATEGSTGAPPLAYRDTDGTLRFNADAIGVPPEGLVAEGNRRRRARQPLPRHHIAQEIMTIDEARRLMQLGEVEYRTQSSAEFWQLWVHAGGLGGARPIGHPPIGYVTADNRVVINLESFRPAAELLTAEAAQWHIEQGRVAARVESAADVQWFWNESGGIGGARLSGDPLIGYVTADGRAVLNMAALEGGREVATPAASGGRPPHVDEAPPLDVERRHSTDVDDGPPTVVDEERPTQVLTRPPTEHRSARVGQHAESRHGHTPHEYALDNPPSVLALGRYQRPTASGVGRQPAFNLLLEEAQNATGFRPILMGGLETVTGSPRGEPPPFGVLSPSGLASAVGVQEALEGGGPQNIRAIYLNTMGADFYHAGPLARESAFEHGPPRGAQTPAEYRNVIAALASGTHQVDVHIQHEGGLSVVRAGQQVVEGAPLPPFLQRHLPPSFFGRTGTSGGGPPGGTGGQGRSGRGRTGPIAPAGVEHGRSTAPTDLEARERQTAITAAEGRAEADDGAAPPSGGGGPNIRTRLNSPDAARWLRDQWILGNLGPITTFLGRGEDTRAILQGEWERVGGSGDPPMLWVDMNNRLVYNARRIGAASLETRHIGRLAGEGVRRPINDADEARNMIDNPPEGVEGSCLYRCPDAEAMERLWRAARQQGDPPAAFVTERNNLVVNMEALGDRRGQWTWEDWPRRAPAAAQAPREPAPPMEIGYIRRIDDPEQVREEIRRYRENNQPIEMNSENRQQMGWNAVKREGDDPAPPLAFIDSLGFLCVNADALEG